MPNRESSELHDADDLLLAMASPDPSVRDGWAYRELADGIRDGRFDGARDLIRARAVQHLSHPQVQARTFAPLILTWLVEAGDRDRAAWEAVAQWYVTERDTRGYDDALGWLHAVAHGADYLAAAVRHGIATPAVTLDVLVERMLVDGDAWVDQEDARVAHAILAALTDDDDGDGARAARRILDALAAHARAQETSPVADAPGRPPMWLRNVTWTCAIVHSALAERPIVDGSAVVLMDVEGVRAGFADVLAVVLPFVMERRS